MKKIILCIITMTIGLSASALSWLGNPYTPYQNPTSIMPTQVVDYNNIQQNGQPYTQTYIQTPYQTQCQSPGQYPGQYINPYNYQRYGYGGYPIVNSTLNGVAGGSNQIIKNIGRSMIYSMLRGY